MAVALLLAASGSFAMGLTVDPLAATKSPSLGSHTLLVQTDGEGVNPAITAPVSTQEAGSSLLVLVGGFASNASLPSDTYGNTWVRRDPVVTYNGYGGRFNTAAYVALSARGGAGHRVRLAKEGEEAGEITAPFIEIRNAGVLQDVAQNYPTPDLMSRLTGKVRHVLDGANENGGRADLTSASVTTTGPATLVAVWWGDAYVYRMTAVPNNGFKVIDRFLELPPNSGVQCAVAVRQVDRAGSYQVTWSGTPAQGAILWLFAFQAKR
ncbi:hypothetical protein [Pseudoxanthomonas sp.]|uniref:hypothetical protein n=1 Tax=Pseudoxanthomonas sp. TaxID=1871049 RepID=UPI0026253ED0|nr:hypothetical protein [Pseudoxanthomonas sp.]WDS36894.1 MAG: hypothetical protein O8I58_03010 [Pseudoxanthomonas sp.]